MNSIQRDIAPRSARGTNSSPASARISERSHMLTGQIVNGLVSGAMYALVAIGFTLVIGVLDKLNFAHPEVLMFGEFVGVISVGTLPLPLAFVLALLIGGVLGLMTEFIAFRRFQSADAKITAALASLALGLIVTDLVHKVWGTEAVALPTYGWVYRADQDAGRKMGLTNMQHPSRHWPPMPTLIEV